MKKILSAEQIQALEAHTMAHESITSLVLMEHAAEAMTRVLTMRYSLRHDFCIFAGAGNNGGDALAVARLLAEQGYRVSAYLFNPKGELSPECEANRDRLVALGDTIVSFVEVVQQFVPPMFTPDTVIVDGLFGAGLNRPLEGGFVALVQFVNASGRPVVAIDLPSGLPHDGHSIGQGAAIVRATHTLMLGCAKLVHYLPDAQPYLGEVEVVDIGLDAEAWSEVKPLAQVVESVDVAPLLRSRLAFGHKGTFGHGLLVAGSAGMAGAAILAGEAALRSGMGKLTVATSEACLLPIQIRLPEAVVDVDTPPAVMGMRAVAVGPGLGQSSQVWHMVQMLLSACVTQPLVLDADALNALSEQAEWYEYVPQQAILTPHPTEFDRLAGVSHNAYARYAKAQALAKTHGFYILLKGHHTMLFTPDGDTYVNTTGNAGMATAGSGDVLTGMLLGLLAQGYDPRTTCLLGMHLHGRAGDEAAQRLGQHAVLASDIIAHLPQAFLKLQNG